MKTNDIPEFEKWGRGRPTKAQKERREAYQKWYRSKVEFDAIIDIGDGRYSRGGKGELVVQYIPRFSSDVYKEIIEEIVQDILSQNED